MTVTDGTVDLIKSGDFGIGCKGGTGSCVDLDGSTSNAGLTSSNSFTAAAGQKATLSFSLAGNQRGGPSDSVDARITFSAPTSGTWGATFGSTPFGPVTLSNASFVQLTTTMFSNDAFQNFTLFFTPSTATSFSFSFANAGGDNVGAILDDVSVSLAVVPEPASWAMMIAGFGLVGAGLRRRESRAVFA